MVHRHRSRWIPRSRKNSPRIGTAPVAPWLSLGLVGHRLTTTGNRPTLFTAMPGVLMRVCIRLCIMLFAARAFWGPRSCSPAFSSRCCVYVCMRVCVCVFAWLPTCTAVLCFMLSHRWLSRCLFVYRGRAPDHNIS